MRLRDSFEMNAKNTSIVVDDCDGVADPSHGGENFVSLEPKPSFENCYGQESTSVHLFSPDDYVKESFVPIKDQPLPSVARPFRSQPPGRRRNGTRRRSVTSQCSGTSQPDSVKEDDAITENADNHSIANATTQSRSSTLQMFHRRNRRRSSCGNGYSNDYAAQIMTPRSVHSSNSCYTEMTYHSDTDLQSDDEEVQSCESSLYLPDAGILFQKIDQQNGAKEWLASDEDDTREDYGHDSEWNTDIKNNLSMRTIESFFSLNYVEAASTVSSLSMGEINYGSSFSVDSNTDGETETEIKDCCDKKIEVVFSSPFQNQRKRLSRKIADNLTNLLEEGLGFDPYEEESSAGDVKSLDNDTRDEEEYIEEVLLNDIDKDDEDEYDIEVLDETSVEEEIEEFTIGEEKGDEETLGEGNDNDGNDDDKNDTDDEE